MEKEDAVEKMLEIDERFDRVKNLFVRDVSKEKRPERSDYDSALTMLRMDYGMKAKATDRLKTEEEIALEKAQKLQKLE
eukprot:Pgem_evm1s3164